MKVLYWTETFWPDISGVAVLGMQLLPALQKRGYEFIIVTSHGRFDLPNRTRFRNIPIYRFPFHTVLLERNLGKVKTVTQRVAELKQTFKPDLVHINSSEPSIFFHLHTDAMDSASTLVTVHLFLTHNYGTNTLYGRVLQSANWVTAVSRAILRDVRLYLPEVTLRSSVIHNGLMTPSLEPTPLPFASPHLLCLGRVSVEKGFDLAVDAFALLLQHFPSVRMVVAGNGTARSDLQRRAVQLGIDDAIEFIGWIAPEKVPELINKATVVVMPSRWHEPFGLVALQAAQMARPVVATSVGGLPEVILHKRTGLLVEKENSTKLAEQIAFLLENPDDAIQMGQAARQRAQRMFSLERLVDDYDALYRKLARRENE